MRYTIAHKSISNSHLLYLQAGNFKKALAQYEKMVKVLDVYKEEEKEKTNPSKCVAHLNAALCQLKVNLFQDAKKNCDKALEIEANNVKGLFRRGQVLVLYYLSYSL